MNETEIKQMLNIWKQEQATKEINPDPNKVSFPQKIYRDYECSTELEGLTKENLETWLSGLTNQIDTEMVSILKNGTEAGIEMRRSLEATTSGTTAKLWKRSATNVEATKIVYVSWQGEPKQKKEEIK